MGRAASLSLFCQESTTGMRLHCLLPCLVGIRGRVRCAGRCRTNRRCQCFSPRSPSGTGVILGHALGDEPASVPVNRSPPKRVGAVNSGWLFPRGCSAEPSFLAATSQRLVPPCMGLQRSLPVSLSVASISLVCFYLTFLFYQWKKLLLRRQL